MKAKLSKWYKGLNICFKVIICISSLLIILSLFWITLSWLGIWSSYIKNINTSNIGKDWLKGFVYSIKFFFINENNKVNWIVLGGLGVFISYWITISENSKKIDADLIADARIKWLQEVRSLSAQIINSYSNLLGFKIKYRNEWLSNEDVENVRKFLEESKETRMLLNSLLLFIGDDTNPNTEKKLERNRQNNSGCNYVLIKMIESMIDEINYKEKLVNDTTIFKLRFNENEWFEVTGLIKKIEIDIPRKRSGRKKIQIEIGRRDEKHHKQNKKIIEYLKVIDDEESKKFNESVNYFTNTMRDYLKIEWKDVSINKK